VSHGNIGETELNVLTRSMPEQNVSPFRQRHIGSLRSCEGLDNRAEAQKEGGVMKRNCHAAGVFLSLMLLTSPVCSADIFPSKAINVWVAYGAGSGTDISQRAIANIASKALGQPIIVSNVAGGAGALALGRLKVEKPDGYTLATSSTGSFSRIPLLQPVPFNAKEPLKEFTPIIGYSSYVHALAVRADSPWKTFEDFITYAKANPGKIRYSTSGVGLGQHLAMEYIAMKENIKWTHVPFQTSPQAVAALLGGHVEALSQTPEWKEHVDAGALRLLVCWNENRMPFYPDVPTVKEKGYDFTTEAKIVIWAPANTPQEVTGKLGKAFRQATETEEVKKLLTSLSYPFDIKEKAEVISIMKKDYEINEKIFKKLGLGIFKK
jgi:tripartite-type tricarboxylate transporter receptor subunit TctC